MYNIWAYSLASVLVVSLVSFVGVFTLPIKLEKIKEILTYMVSFSAGALFGDAFIHLIPEAVKYSGFTLNISLYIMSGITVSFFFEKIIHWRHSHIPITEQHVHPFAVVNLLGDVVHNFIDGLTIGASYLVGMPVGTATTLAVVLHEIPHEIGNFGVLLHGGFSRTRALFVNFLTALTAIVGTVFSLLIGSSVPNITTFLVPFAAGGFIYISGSDLIPELHKEVGAKKSFFQFIMFVSGIAVMMAILALE